MPKEHMLGCQVLLPSRKGRLPGTGLRRQVHWDLVECSVWPRSWKEGPQGAFRGWPAGSPALGTGCVVHTGLVTRLFGAPEAWVFGAAGGGLPSGSPQIGRAHV